MPELKMNVVNLYQCDPGFSTAERIFDYDYLLYVHRGKGVYKIGSDSCLASMGDLFYCPPFVANTILADKEDPFLLSGIEFCAPEYRSIMKKRYTLLEHRFLIDVIQEMIREYRYGKIGSDEICGELLTVLMKNLERMSHETSAGKRDPAEEMLDYLANNLHRTVTHRELTAVFAYHKNSINRFLKRVTGLSLKNYVIELRIRKASELLRYSTKTVGEIGELCGYNSTVFFSRQFREKTGLTPMQYRTKLMQGF